jgi:hypothetical protein
MVIQLTRLFISAITVALLSTSQWAWAVESAAAMLMRYQSQVKERLDVPVQEIPRYAKLIEDSLKNTVAPLPSSQYIFVVDRDPNTQAGFLFWRSKTGDFILVGASPVSTGQSDESSQHLTPLGVFEHNTNNLDFRSDGVANSDGIRRYGVKGMRVFNFVWQQIPHRRADGTQPQASLLMHATDPDLLERRLGRVQSTGNIYISASLNRLLDHEGVLDADYEAAVNEGRKLDILQDSREPALHAGRYLVVVDSGRIERPAWSPAPFLPHRRSTTPALH